MGRVLLAKASIKAEYVGTEPTDGIESKALAPSTPRLWGCARPPP